jgi:protein-S-isoprenylcysteine O-methyltransferase Ste14
MLLRDRLEYEGNFLFKYRGLLPILFLLGECGFLIFSEEKITTSFFSQISYFSVGLAGLAIRIFVVGYSPADTSGRNTLEGQKAASLNTTGAYSLVRNPLYVGNFFLWLSVALFTQSFLFLLLFTCIYWIYYERIILAEEAFLQTKFKESYTQWATCVPAFIPQFTRYISPTLSFSWKKVIKKEKNGFAALFTLFFFLDSLQKYHLNSSFQPTDSPWSLPFLISAVLYFSLKYIKRFTNWLEEEGR